ncbi:MAG TPA: nuclear transport factor 2 family protein [Mycobacterium sp.]|nr:nuclear transport factor 2 family protein [Mycobacterium sp.]HPZ95520.1 nuclear transport factor 2 family protein [Mycobacterium sp.]HQE13836.1 nuclear transport factor 2 family protein [Mycobacterium sp.]
MTMSSQNAVPPVIERWLQIIESGLNGERDDSLVDLLAEDAVFRSPAVFTPQRGRDLTAAYLRAAEHMFAGTDFHYVEKWFGENSAVLHFAAMVKDPSGKDLSVEGIDMIHWNDDGKITEFTVMIRPFKALQGVMGAMAALLAPPS